MHPIIRTFGLGTTAGLRTFAPVTAVSLISGPKRTGPVSLTLIALALGELVGDKLPSTPSRKMPPAFVARVVSGALSGALLGRRYGRPMFGGLSGALGAVAGTLGGYAVRSRLSAAIGRDWPVAIAEDTVAIMSAALLTGDRREKL